MLKLEPGCGLFSHLRLNLRSYKEIFFIFFIQCCSASVVVQCITEYLNVAGGKC